MENTESGIKATDLPFLLYRLREPCFYPKGDTRSGIIQFMVSPEYLPTVYRDNAAEFLNRFEAGDGVQRRDISSHLDDELLNINLDEINVVKRQEEFIVFAPRHHRAAGQLIKIFMDLPSIEKLIAFAVYVRERINCGLFVFSFLCALYHRPDTKNLKLPSIAQIFPKVFVNREAVSLALERADILQNPNNRIAIEIPTDMTGNDRDAEHRLAYFREDLGINSHHWHWHMVYPYDGPINIVNKDRRGELFYYMHSQILARYNAERLCNSMELAKRLDWDEPIKEGYFPMLSSMVSGKSYANRPDNMKLANINRPDLNMLFEITDLKHYEQRIYDAINKKSALATNKSEISLINEKGIDVLGNMIESSPVLSPNLDFYGVLHNYGHLAIGHIHDPEYHYIQSAGVMDNNATAMRDPVFYRWHTRINEIFLEYKKQLPPYTKSELTFEGVEITAVEVCSYDQKQTCREMKNQLHTHFMHTDIDLSRGLDFGPKGPILVRVTHLNHEDFVYVIKVQNTSKQQLVGTVRIFMSPALKESATPSTVMEQKTLMIEMDRFVAELRPGESNIVRRSTESRVTIPFDQIFPNPTADSMQDKQPGDASNYCGCGWPYHMLLPRGSRGGFDMELFVMITDYEEDRVKENGPMNYNECRTGMSYCGLSDRFYPDKRPMGYPFDRPFENTVDSMKKFMTPNMFSTAIKIFHSDKLRRGRLVAKNSISLRELDKNQSLNITDNNDIANKASTIP